MTKRAPILMVIVASLLFVGCVQLGGPTKSPAWLANGYDKAYPEDKYLNAVGSGANRERAVDSALGSLSQTFNSQVRSVTHVDSLYTKVEDGKGSVTFTESTDLMESSTVTSLTENLIGAAVTGLYTDANGRVYARVSLHRKRTSELYKARLDALALSIAQTRGKSLMESDPLRFYLTLLSTHALVEEQQALYNQLQVLLRQPQPQVLLSFERDLAAAASKLSIVVDVDADEDAKAYLQAAFEKQLQALGMATRGQDDKTFVLKVQYRVEPIQLSGSPYANARYTLAARLHRDSEVYFSFEKSERETALSQADAVARALKSAGTRAVDEFFTLLVSGSRAEIQQEASR